MLVSPVVTHKSLWRIKVKLNLCTLYLRMVQSKYTSTFPRWMIILFKYFNNFNISNIEKEVNKELPDDDLIEDRNILECSILLPHIHDG